MRGRKSDKLVLKRKDERFIQELVQDGRTFNQGRHPPHNFRLQQMQRNWFLTTALPFSTIEE